MFWSGLLSTTYPSVARRARQRQVWKSAKPSSSFSSSSSFECPTGRLAGPENMIHSPNCFALPCAVSFHKINAGYEATHSSGKWLRMIVLVSLTVMLRGFLCFHDFSHGASLHPYDFCTCIYRF